MMPSASFRFLDSASIYKRPRISTKVLGRRSEAFTCSSRQHTGPFSHLEPHKLTNFCRTASSGWRARSLSGQGSSPPKIDCFPQWPRIAQRPFSCIRVSPCAPTSAGCKAREPSPTSAATKPTGRIFAEICSISSWDPTNSLWYRSEMSAPAVQYGKLSAIHVCEDGRECKAGLET